MFKQLVSTQIRFLLFLSIKPDLKQHFGYYFSFILVVTWLVGVGRYWHNPDSLIWQRAGLSSLIYIFVVSQLLYLVVLPLRPKNWSYKEAFVLLGLTSLPGLLYAFPLESFMSFFETQIANALLFLVIGAWRFALCARSIYTLTKIGFWPTITATLVFIAAVNIPLALINMGRPILSEYREDQAPYDLIYLIIVLYAFTLRYQLPIFAGYGLFIYLAQRKHHKKGELEQKN